MCLLLCYNCISKSCTFYGYYEGLFFILEESLGLDFGRSFYDTAKGCVF